MSKIVKIGKNSETRTEVSIGLEKLTTSRLLIQANSGGGKTTGIKKLLEATHSMIQHIVLDPEGEYSTLREKYDYILVGSDGDIQADVKTAEMLAKKVLEHRVSVIIDLYELNPEDRKLYVKKFCDSLINAPREIWNDALVVVDEAHIFAPEKESSVATNSIISLASRGRKRGLCLVAGTQRISKLHKDVVAECQNKLIGLTNLDLDRKRAAAELGFKPNESDIKLRQLDAGEFFAYGPAISKDVIKLVIDKPATSLGNQKGKARNSVRTKPTAKIKDILSRLGDLPQEAKRELEDKVGLQNQIRELQKQLAEAKRSNPTPKSTQPTKEDIAKLTQSAELSVRKELTKQFEAQLQKAKSDLVAGVKDLVARMKLGQVVMPLETFKSARFDAPIKASPVANVKVSVSKSNSLDSAKSLGRAEREVLAFLSMSPGKSFMRQQIGALTGYAHAGGAFSNTLTALRKSGFISSQGSAQMITQEGLDYCLQNGLEPKDPVVAREQWLQKLGAAERKIYEFVLQNRDQAFTREELAEGTQYTAGGGNFTNAISKLNTLGLIQKNSDKTIQYNQALVDL